MTNTDIRCEMKKKRSSLSSSEVEASSKLIFEKIKTLDFIFDKQNFLIYRDFKNEVKTDKIISYLRLLNKTVAHPITTGENMIAAVPIGEGLFTIIFYLIAFFFTTNSSKIAKFVKIIFC